MKTRIGRCSGSRVGCIPSRDAADTAATTGAFTIIELLIVMSIIIVLAGLILATSGYVQKKGARSRAEAEIAAISAALENYKADNGIYPRGNAAGNQARPTDTDKLDAKKQGNPAASEYAAASLFLYKSLTGDSNADRNIEAGETGVNYFAFKSNQLSPSLQTSPVTFVRDPFGNSYGYSTAYQDYQDELNGTGAYSAPDSSATIRGYNPTFDLWSTAGESDGSTSPSAIQWIKNW